ncbi:hypothetical protein BRADI_4g24201v3 [Brachypodium distachyon]|uniref:Serpin domain-containing protein n=1 Tax=Brachypodium distachyon TaxID=15368 RepID=A0A0Q3ISQ7_BRADI|nr:hypothetical protein BRADI_4g24201v3 [Brachypodium distachyon]
MAALSAVLARVLVDEHTGRNLVFSPLSIYAGLALVAAGARGATLDEFLRVLGALSRGELEEFLPRAAALMRDRSGGGGPRVAWACGVWSGRSSCRLKPGFVEAVVCATKAAEGFRGDVDGACRRINAWAVRVTRGLIDNVVTPEVVRPDTRVVVGNAVYFKGKWAQPFDKKLTADWPFRLAGTGKVVVVEVPFMQSREQQYIAVHRGFKVLKLPYKMADRSSFFPPFDFTIAGAAPLSLDDDGFHSDCPPEDCDKHSDHRVKLSPSTAAPSFNSNKRGRANSPRPAVAPYSSNNKKNKHGGSYDLTQFSMCIFLPDADDMASATSFDVDEFRVPRFKLSFDESLNAALHRLGLVLPFSESADLSDMALPPDVYMGLPMVLHRIIHKAVVEGNEEGTEAPAVTTCIVGIGCGVDFVADHPSAYFIVEEETGAVVFAGHVLDPSRE